MIDYLTLALTHGLMLLALLRLLSRPDLDRDGAAPPPRRTWRDRKAQREEGAGGDA